MGYMNFLKKVIEGSLKSKEEVYVVYTPSKEIKYYKNISNKRDIYLATAQVIENLLFESCMSRIENFVKSNSNKDVYAIVLYLDTDGGCNGLSFNTEQYYQNIVKERYNDYNEDALTSIHGVRYNEGSFAYRYFGPDFDGAELHEVMGAYYCINVDHPINDVSKKIAFCKSFFESELVNVGINVVNRLREIDLGLNKTEDFMFYVSLHDVDDTTIARLMKKTVPNSTFNKLFPKFKDA